MKTYRFYIKCSVDVEAESAEDAENIINEMDFSFFDNGDEFRSEIIEIEDVKELDNQ